jgi:hypothetical protein
MIVQPDSKKYWKLAGDEDPEKADLDSGAKDLIDYLEIRENGK